MGGIGLRSGLNADNAIRIETDAGANETIVIHSNQGTGEDYANSSILLLSDVGGIGLTATGLTGVMTDGNSDAAVQLTALAGGIGIRSTANLAGSIQIEADGGASETIVIRSDQGTSAAAVTESDAAIQLLADVGGIGLRSGLNAVNAIRLEADAGTSETIIIHSNQGTSVTEGAASVQLTSDVGGINLLSGKNADNAINIVVDAGTDETIRIQSDLGTKDYSIDVQSDAGGMFFRAGTNITFQSTTDSTDFWQIVDSNNTFSGGRGSGNPIVNVDSTNEMVAIGIDAPKVAMDVHYLNSDPTGQNSNATKLTNDTGGGHVVYFGTGTLTAGKIYYLGTDGAWAAADADDTAKGAYSLVGIALGSSAASNGVLIRGFFNAASYASNFAKGKALYISNTAGEMDTVAPSGCGEFIRVMGYCTDTANVIWFDPDGTWVQIAA